MSLELVTMVRQPRRFDVAGQALPFHLTEVENQIKPGLANRLRDYAIKDLQAAGFGMVVGWACEVSTSDGDQPARYRYYVVTFTHPYGGQLGLQGIIIGKGGWPVLDHGIFAERG